MFRGAPSSESASRGGMESAKRILMTGGSRWIVLVPVDSAGSRWIVLVPVDNAGSGG